MEFDYLHLYVDDYQQAHHCYQQKWSFTHLDTINSEEGITGIYQQGHVLLLISAPISQSPMGRYSNYLEKHPPGIGEIAWHIEDWSNFQHQLGELKIQTTPIVHPLTKAGGLTFLAWGDVRHSVYPSRLPLLATSAQNIGLSAIDHVVLNVSTAEFAQASQWYQQLFGWSVQQSFTINTPHSGLYSEALINSNGKVQFNLNCPSSDNSQIQKFLEKNRGPGIQHVAFASPNIINAVHNLKKQGVEFLSVPVSYYQHQKEQQGDRGGNDDNLDWQILQQLEILLDQKTVHSQELLLQIFSLPCYGVGTLFWEIIERRQRAKGFGEGNFQALYEAVEALENKSVS